MTKPKKTTRAPKAGTRRTKVDVPVRTREPAVAGMPRLLSIEEVAEVLGVSVRHVRRLVFEHRIPYVKWGHLLRFDPSDLQTWIRSSTQPDTA